MDLTVRDQKKGLLAYIETKTTRAAAKRLVDALEDLSGKPIPKLPTNKRGVRDGVKKMDYLLEDATAGTVAFAVRAPGDGSEPIYERAFLASVEHDARTVTLKDLSDPVPLHVELSLTSVDHRRAQACLLWNIERSGAVMLRRGSNGDYLAYRDTDATRVLVGGEARGSVYTALEALDAAELAAFDACLRDEGFMLGNIESGRNSRIWKRCEGGKGLILTDEDVARRLGAKLGAVLRG